MLVDEEKQGLLSPGKKDTVFSFPKGLIVEQDWCFVKVPSTGLRQLNGISSSYSTEYPPQLKGVVDQAEFIDIIKRLNDTIRSYWPCNLCYFFGYGCSICTCGLSLLCPQYCMSYSEEHASEMLKNVSLKSKYYERMITFKITKNFCISFVEIKFPVSAIPREILFVNEKENIDEDGSNEQSWGVVLNQPTRLKNL